MFRFSAISKIRKQIEIQPKSRRKKSTSVRRMQDQTTQEQHPPRSFIPPRHWEQTKLQLSLDNSGKVVPTSCRDHAIFTVASYNILAQDLLESHPELYAGIPRQCLEWSHRKRCILNEIGRLQPDILCIQEMQSDHLEGFTETLRQRFTFDRVFKKRTGSEKTDGCAIFFNSDLFQLIETRTVEYNQQIRLLDRDNIGIILKLRSRANPKSIFIVGTTHLLYNPKRMDIKLAQVHVLLSELEQMAYNGNKDNGYYPIILTGDFNLAPNSPPYKLLAHGQLDYRDLPQQQPIISSELGITDTCQHVHSIKCRDSNESPLHHSERKNSVTKHNIDDNDADIGNLFNTGFLRHPLHLTSTQRQRDPSRASTHHNDWIMVDYLFYSRYLNAKMSRVIEGNLKLLSFLNLPTVADCEQMGMIPNDFLGSDHFSLAARFLLRHPR